MCVGQYSYLRVVVCCGDYILHLGENIVYTFFGCCTYYYNLPRWIAKQDGGIVKDEFPYETIPQSAKWLTAPFTQGSLFCRYSLHFKKRVAKMDFNPN